MTTDQDQTLHLILDICEEHLRRADTTTREHIDTLLRERDITGGTGWLIDILGLTRLRLQPPTHQAEPNPPHTT